MNALWCCGRHSYGWAISYCSDLMSEAAWGEYDIALLCVYRRPVLTYFKDEVTRYDDPPFIKVKVPMSFASGPRILANCEGSVFSVLDDCELAFRRISVQVIDPGMDKVRWFSRQSTYVSVD